MIRKDIVKKKKKKKKKSILITAKCQTKTLSMSQNYAYHILDFLPKLQEKFDQWN